MSVSIPKRVAKAFERAALASTSTERGRHLEQLVAHLFGLCPGVRHYNSNALNAKGSSEVDVCFWNERRSLSLDFLPHIVIVECKNTGRRVGSGSVRIFLSKIQDMGLDHGILIAANGITGKEDSLRAAHDVIRVAFQAHKIRLIVVTRAELERIQEVSDLIRLLQDKILLLTMQAKTF